MSDLAAFARLLATDTKDYVAGYVTKALGVLSTRLADLEKHVADLSGLSIQGPVGPQGEPGKDGQPADTERIKSDLTLFITSTIREEVVKAMAGVPVPKDGRDGRDADIGTIKSLAEAFVTGNPRDMPDVAALVREEVQKSVAAIPVAKNGRDGKDADPELIKAEIAERISALPPAKDGRDGKDGASIDPAIVDVMVSAQVERAVSALPKPQNGLDGKSLTLDDVAPLIAREIDRAVKTLEPGKDGTGVKGLLINRDGHLVATLTDGSTLDAGMVVGHDGKDADPDLMAKMIAEAVDQIPRPQNGKDGADGLGIDDADLVFNEKTGFVLRLSNATRTKDLALPVPFWDETYKYGEKYFKGAIVNCKGVWIAESDTYERPGDGATSWRLIAKNGRDGKDMIMGPDGPELRR